MDAENYLCCKDTPGFATVDQSVLRAPKKKPMKTGQGVTVRLLFAVLCLLPGTGYAIDCSGLPTSFTGNEFPNGDFFTNFNNPCYTIPLGSGNGDSLWGDLNAVYFQSYFKVDPQYELILV